MALIPYPLCQLEFNRVALWVEWDDVQDRVRRAMWRNTYDTTAYVRVHFGNQSQIYPIPPTGGVTESVNIPANNQVNLDSVWAECRMFPFPA